MNLAREYKRIILPILKGSPIIILLVAGAIYFTKNTLSYVKPKYQAVGSLKINTRNNTQGQVRLFENETVSVNPKDQNVLTELEIIKSKDMIEKTVKMLNWELSVSRIGDILETELVDERPFDIVYTIQDTSKVYGKKFVLTYKGISKFILQKENKKETTIAFNEIKDYEGINIQIVPKKDFIATKKLSLTKEDKFAIQFNTPEQIAKKISKENLFIKQVDKEVAVLNIYYQDFVPEKAKEFTNALMQTYIFDSQFNNKNNSTEALAYLDEQINNIEGKLRNAEGNLSIYRQSHNVTDSRIESDASLRKLTQMDLHKMDISMQVQELDKLQKYLSSGKNLNEFSPNFEGLEDAVFKDAFIKTQNLELQKQDLLQKFQPKSTEVIGIEAKINNMRSFINQSVTNSLENLNIRANEIANSIKRENNTIKTYPEKERQITLLEREVLQHETMYNYLVTKRTEVAINSTTDNYPHKVIDYATKPTQPVSPNKPLYYGLATLLALLVGFAISYIYNYFTVKIKTKSDIEDIVKGRFLGSVWEAESSFNDSFTLMSNLVANLIKIKPSENNLGSLMVISSSIPGEGKSFTSHHLSKSLALTNKKVLLIDMDLRLSGYSNKSIERLENNSTGVAGIINGMAGNPYDCILKTQTNNLDYIPSGDLHLMNQGLIYSNILIDFIKKMQESYDVVIVDTPPIGVFEDAFPIMNHANANILICRSNFTKERIFRATMKQIKEWELPNYYLVLNDAPASKIFKGYYRKMKRDLSQKPALANAG